MADALPGAAGDRRRRAGAAGAGAARRRTRAAGARALHRALDDPAPLYRGFDVFALSSDTEQMPLSVIEAMAAGLPVAATDVGDVAAMLAAENQRVRHAAGRRGAGQGDRGTGAGRALRARVGAANRAKAEAEFGQAAMVAAWQACSMVPDENWPPDLQPAVISRVGRVYTLYQLSRPSVEQTAENG